MPDWKKEKEHRIVIQKDIFGCNSIEERKFTYNPLLLTGIIFGIKTTDKQKKKLSIYFKISIINLTIILNFIKLNTMKKQV